MTIELVTKLNPGVIRAGEGDRHNVFGHALNFKTTTEELGGGGLLWEMLSPPGTMVPPHVHTIEDEFIYVAEGELDVMVGDRRFSAGVGDLIKLPKTIPHGIWQKGDTTTRTLWVSCLPTRWRACLQLWVDCLRTRPPTRPRLARYLPTMTLTFYRLPARDRGVVVSET